jgi:hypothetical protein
MKKLLASDDVTTLQALKDQITAGVDPAAAAILAASTAGTVAGTPSDKTDNKDATDDNTVEYDDKTNREKVITALDAIVAKDAKNPIPYKWGSRDDAAG